MKTSEITKFIDPAGGGDAGPKGNLSVRTTKVKGV